MLPCHKEVQRKERSNIYCVLYRNGRHGEGVAKELLLSFMFVYKFLFKKSLIHTYKSVYCKINVLYNTDYMSDLIGAGKSLHSVNDSYVKSRERVTIQKHITHF